MPELPEVETVKRELERTIVGKTLLSPLVYYRPLIHQDEIEYEEGVDHQRIDSVSRKGKFLLIHLENGKKILFHLRMEGKLFVVDKEKHSLEHLSLFFPFENDNQGLAFYDVRKFGVTMLLKETDDGPLASLGLEPSQIVDSNYLYEKIKTKRKPIKELLLDQSIIAGIGNIYDSEILFLSHISPFKKGCDLSLEECQKIVSNSKIVMEKAIENNGSTIRTYQASQKVHGQFQEFLNVYQNTGLCKCCGELRIQKITMSGRGTYFCPKCQKTGISVAVTGKIGSGKSLATSYFGQDGFLTLSCDDIVHSLYEDESFLKNLSILFPSVFIRKRLSKERITDLLQKDKTFKRKYESYLFRQVKSRIESFIIETDGINKAIEVPLLFDAHLESLFTFLVGVETPYQKEHLEERGDKNIEKRLDFNRLNSYDKNRDRLSFILHSDSTKEHLKKQVDDIVRQIEEKLK